MKRAIVTGAGGFIGSHLVRYLKNKNYRVMAIDIKFPEYSRSVADEYKIADLRSYKKTVSSFETADELYMLAADMGGVGYIDTVSADIISNNAEINLNTLKASVKKKITTVFFASSACVYPQEKQQNSMVTPLKEKDAIPAHPDTAYGWEKLFTEQVCLSFARDKNLSVRIARFHNIYGPEGAFQGGREKSPAAICRKVAMAKEGEFIEIWGDGKQTRSYCYIDDCCEGVYRLMQSSYQCPVNIGTSEQISINELVNLVSRISGKNVGKRYEPDKPQGVRGRNSDNTLVKKILNWEPQIPLSVGLTRTYRWIESQLKKKS